MRIQGIRLLRDREPQKGSIYEFADNRTIRFLDNHDTDVTDVSYELKEKQRGFFAEEYRPVTIAKENAKVVDITAFVMDDEVKKCTWYLYDVKESVGGEDVISHLYEQWQAGLTYLKYSVLAYLEEYTFDRHLGVITRSFDERRIKREKESKSEKIEEIKKMASLSLAGAKRKVTIPMLQAEERLLENMLERKFIYHTKEYDEEYDVDIRISKEAEPGKYYYCLGVKG